MGKYTELILALTFIASLSFNAVLWRDLEKKDRENTNLRTHLQDAEAKLRGNELNDLDRRAQAQKTLEELQKDLKEHQDRREKLQTDLAEAKNFNSEGREANTQKWDLEQQKDLVKGLSQQLSDVQGQRKHLEQQLKDLQKGQKITQQQAVLDLDQQIRTEQIRLSELETQYKQLRAQRANWNAQYQAQQMPAQISDEKVLIEHLKSQKTAANLDWEAEQNKAATNWNQKIYDLKLQEDEIKNRLNQERNLQNKMSDDLKNSQGQAKADQNRIQDIQKQIQNEDTQINLLKEQIKLKQKDLG